MTLTQQTRARITGILGTYRSDWQSAGVEAALTRTSQQHPDDDLLVIALAVAAARDAKALTPATMHTRAVDGPVAPAVTPRPTPRATDPECGVCGSQIVRNDGTCHGCHLDGLTEKPPRPTSPTSKPYRTVAPPPPDFWAQVQSHKPARTAVEPNKEN